MAKRLLARAERVAPFELDPAELDPAERDPARVGERCSAHRAGASVDDGSTFIEVVVAVVLLAVMVVPILGGVQAATRASSVARSAANVETILINAVDRVNRSNGLLHEICDYHPYARAAVVTHGWTDSEVSTVTEYLDTSTNTWQQGALAKPGCPDPGGYQPDLIQRVTITVNDPSGDIRRSIQVVKSNV